MNSPDYNHLVYIFNLPTPVSPLPSTPVASPSHEPDGTMEQSMVSMEPLRDPPKIPVKKVDSQRRSRKRRPRYPRRSYPRVFRRPLYAHRFPQAQVFFHTQGLAMLCLRDHSFMLTSGVYLRSWVSE
ncbi:hypothetical protein TNCV_1905551 [Trichonephila clavipes]|nr:hypothetical protein TNCV_1905551 [Trichonephila clavipes]